MSKSKTIAKELEEMGSVETSTHILCILPPTALLPHAAQTRCFDEESVTVFSTHKKKIKICPKC